MKKFIYGVLLASPLVSMAQIGEPASGGVQGIVDFINAVLAAVVPIIFALAIVYFFWGLAKFIRSAGDPEAQAEGKSIMVWGIVTLAVMISIYGLITWLRDSAGFTTTGSISLPTLPQ